MSDEAFIPWQRAEKPTARTDLQEKLERQQISRLEYLDDVGPTGSRGIALQLTTGARFIIWAGRANQGRFSARLYFRFLPRPLIILPRMERIWHGGRDRDPLAEPPDELQQAVEGCVIHGVLHSTLPMRGSAGEQLAVEMVGGGRLAVGAEPTRARTDEGEILVADLVYAWSDPPKRTYIHGV